MSESFVGIDVSRDHLDLHERPSDRHQRYANDAAFHNGFDALVWAKGDSPASYKSALDALVSRDARFDPTHVTYRM